MPFGWDVGVDEGFGEIVLKLNGEGGAVFLEREFAFALLLGWSADLKLDFFTGFDWPVEAEGLEGERG